MLTPPVAVFVAVSHILPSRQPQGPSRPRRQPHRQMVSGRQPQAQVGPTLHYPAHDGLQSFKSPQHTDQLLTLAHLSSHQTLIEQQAAVLASYQRQRQPSQVLPDHGNETHGSRAEASDAADALELPLASRNPGNESLGFTESETLVVDACVICMDADKDWLCLPCGHLAMCGECSARVKRQTRRCPICQQNIRRIVQVYRA